MEVAKAAVHTCAEEVDADTIHLYPYQETETRTLMGQTVTYRVWLKEFWKTFSNDEINILEEKMEGVEENSTFIEYSM